VTPDADEIAAEIIEREALLADIENQIAKQQSLIQEARAAGQPTRRATLTLIDLHQKADRQRDYLKVIRERNPPVLPSKHP
jgi:capsule polysaccharide export protein KpsE/RkpR